MTAHVPADQDAELRDAPLVYTFSISPVGGSNVRAEGTDRFATEAETTAFMDWARATIAKLRSDLNAAVIQVGEHAHARGEAEGKLRVSEMAGIVEGWREQNERLAADLREAREGNQQLHRRAQKAEAFKARHRGGFNYVLNRRREDRFARRVAERNLIDLAKMYGEACGELQVPRALAQDVADEADGAEYDGFLLTPDPHHAAGSASEESDDASGS